jgi:hypothetical protein
MVRHVYARRPPDAAQVIPHQAQPVIAEKARGRHTQETEWGC